MEVSQTFHLLVAEYTELQTNIQVYSGLCLQVPVEYNKSVWHSSTISIPTTGNVWHSSTCIMWCIMWFILLKIMTIHLNNIKNIAESGWALVSDPSDVCTKPHTFSEPPRWDVITSTLSAHTNVKTARIMRNQSLKTKQNRMKGWICCAQELHISRFSTGSLSCFTFGKLDSLVY